MSTTPNQQTLDDITTFLDEQELGVNWIYLDSEDIPTTGLGTALTINGALRDDQFYLDYFSAGGFDLSQTNSDTGNMYLTDLKTELSENPTATFDTYDFSDQNNTNPDGPSEAPLNIWLSDVQSATEWHINNAGPEPGKNYWESYTAQWSDAEFANLTQDQKVATFSMYWNLPDLIGTGIKAATVDQALAHAFTEIVFNHQNAPNNTMDPDDGLMGRRLDEAKKFLEAGFANDESYDLAPRGSSTSETTQAQLALMNKLFNDSGADGNGTYQLYDRIQERDGTLTDDEGETVDFTFETLLQSELDTIAQNYTDGESFDYLQYVGGDLAVEEVDADPSTPAIDPKVADGETAATTTNLIIGDSTGNMLKGGGGKDFLHGRSGPDNLYGGPGNDLLKGGAGNDELYGGDGNDILRGGAGQDSFSFNTGDILDGGPGMESVSYAGLGTDIRLDINENPGSQFNSASALKVYRSTLGNFENDLYNINTVQLTGKEDNVIVNHLQQSEALTIDAGTQPDDHSDAIIFNDLLTSGVTLQSDGTLKNHDITFENFEVASGSPNDDVIHTDSLDLVVNSSPYGEDRTHASGQGGDDILHGDGRKDWLGGRAGNDTLYGHGGADILYAGEGDDTLYGGAGSDQFYYDPFNDGSGANTFSGGSGNDSFNVFNGLDGQSADTTLIGGSGTDSFNLDNLDNTNNVAHIQDTQGSGGSIFAGPGKVERFLTDNGKLEFYHDGDKFADINGDEDSALGEVHVNGTTHNYTDYRSNAPTAPDDGTSGPDNIDASLLPFGLETDTQAGDDTVAGSDYNDDITTGTGQDQVTANDGDDQINTGDGNDTIAPGSGFDTVDGGSGSDTVSYNSAGTGVSADLGAGEVDENDDGVIEDVLSGIANFAGSLYDDFIVGNDSGGELAGKEGDDVIMVPVPQGGGGTTTSSFTTTSTTTTTTSYAYTLKGGAGNDTLQGADSNEKLLGGEGIDTADYSAASNGVTADLAAGTASGAGSDMLTSIENVTGSAQDDTLTGDAGANILTGGAGDDNLDGGQGSDTADYSAASSSITADLGAGTASGTGSDTLISIENVTGSAQDDSLSGDNGANDIVAGSGDDVLLGGAGDDNLDGGQGSDTADYSAASSSITADLAAGTASGAGSDTLTSIENITGSDQNDTLTGDADANILTGGAGDDSLDGGQGNDTADYSGASSSITADLAAGTANGAGSDTLISIENVTGSAQDDTLTGDAGANVFSPGPGNDSVDGAGGMDTVAYSSASSGIFADLGSGIVDEGRDGSNDDNLISISGVTGTSFGDKLVGDGGANVLQGNSGNDLLLGRGGDDTLNGGDGTDTAKYSATTSALTIDHNAGTVSGVGNDTLSGIENITASAQDDTIIAKDGGDNTYDGGSGSDTLSYAAASSAIAADLGSQKIDEGRNGTDNDNIAGIAMLKGSAQGDAFIGSSADDTLQGLGGDDHFDGTLGDDTLDGGAGHDTVNYAAAGSGITADLLNGTATGQGTDTLTSIESFVGSSYSDTITMAAGVGAGYNSKGGHDSLDFGPYADQQGTGVSLTGTDYSIDANSSGSFSNIEDVTLSGQADSVTYNRGNSYNVDAGGGADTLNVGALNAEASDTGITAGEGQSLNGFETLGTTSDGSDIVVQDLGRSYEAVNGKLFMNYSRFDQGLNFDLNAGTVDAGGSAQDTLTGFNNGSYVIGTDQGDSFTMGNKFGYADGGAGDDTVTMTSGGAYEAYYYQGGSDTVVNASALNDLSIPATATAGDITVNETNVTQTVAQDTDNDGTDDYFEYDMDLQVDVAGFGGVTLQDITKTDDNGAISTDAPKIVFEYYGREIDTSDGDYTVEGSDSNLFGTTRDDNFDLTATSLNYDTGLFSGWAGDDTIKGTANADSLSGSEGDDTVIGRGGDDTLYGSLAKTGDTLRGGAGNDDLRGGEGANTASYSDDPAAVSVDLADGTATDGWGDTDTLTNIANVTGSAYDDTIYVEDGGDNVYDGGAGTDTLDYSGASDAIKGHLRKAKVDEGRDGTDNDSLNNISNLTGTAYDDRLVGHNGSNELHGSAGNDFIRGKDGADTLYGGAGNDEIRGDGGDSTLYGGAGNDLVIGSSSSGANGDDIVNGGAGDDELQGRDGNDTLYGDGGDDLLKSRTGDDTLSGGQGADTFRWFDGSAVNNNDSVTDFDTAENDVLDISDVLTGFDDTTSDIENFLNFQAPDSNNDVAMEVDKDGTGNNHNFVQIAAVNDQSSGLDAQTLYDNGNVIA